MWSFFSGQFGSALNLTFSDKKYISSLLQHAACFQERQKTQQLLVVALPRADTGPCHQPAGWLPSASLTDIWTWGSGGAWAGGHENWWSTRFWEYGMSIIPGDPRESFGKARPELNRKQKTEGIAYGDFCVCMCMWYCGLNSGPTP
jgi:hypothetical protein